MSEDIGDALIEVAVLSGVLADGVSVDVEFTTTFGGSAAGKEVVRYLLHLIRIIIPIHVILT